MVAPHKPWEALHVGEPTALYSNSGGPTTTMSFPHQPQQVPVQQQIAPPLPPRAGRVAYAAPRPTPGFPVHGFPMGSYMGGYPGSYSSFPSYGYGGMAAPRRFDDLEYRFIQMAEQSSAPAFQSIETFVRSFSSVTMMLESTYQAMYMSFRAVLAVAENVARLRGLVRQFVTSLAAVKTITWFYNKIRQLLGLVSETRLREEAWKLAEVSQEASLSSREGAAPASTTWPIVAFFGLMVGGPYLIFKFLGMSQQETVDEWRPLDEGESVACVALYDFKSAEEGELEMRRGEQLLVPADNKAKHTRKGGWTLAARPATAERGYVPANRIAVLRAQPQQPHQYRPNPIGLEKTMNSESRRPTGIPTPSCASVQPSTSASMAVEPRPTVENCPKHEPVLEERLQGN